MRKQILLIAAILAALVFAHSAGAYKSTYYTDKIGDAEYEYYIEDGAAVLQRIHVPYSDEGMFAKIPKTLGGFPVARIDSYTELFVSNSYAYNGANCKGFEVDDDNEYFTVIEGVLYNKDASILIRMAEKDPHTDFTVPDSVASISPYAFADTYSLKTVYIPDSVETIGECPFFASGITSVRLPSGLQILEDGLFFECWHLNSINVPDSVTAVSEGAFCLCSVNSINIGKNVMSISGAAFPMARINEINVSSENKFFSSADGILYNKNKTELIYYPSNKPEASFTVPATVKTIKSYAFPDADHLKSIYIPGTVQIIERYSIETCLLTDIYISKGIQTIESGAFLCNSSDDNTNIFIEMSLDEFQNIYQNYETELSNFVIHTPYKDLTYNANGGENAPQKQLYKKGEMFKLTENIPSRAGYEFLGWSVVKNTAIAQYGAGEYITSDEDAMTLYAVWGVNENLSVSVQDAVYDEGDSSIYFLNVIDTAGIPSNILNVTSKVGKQNKTIDMTGLSGEVSFYVVVRGITPAIIEKYSEKSITETTTATCTVTGFASQDKKTVILKDLMN